MACKWRYSRFLLKIYLVPNALSSIQGLYSKAISDTDSTLIAAWILSTSTNDVIQVLHTCVYLFIYLFVYLFIYLFFIVYISADVNAGQNWLWGYQFQLQIKSLWYSPQRKGTDVINSIFQGGKTFTNCEISSSLRSFVESARCFSKINTMT